MRRLIRKKMMLLHFYKKIPKLFIIFAFQICLIAFCRNSFSENQFIPLSHIKQCNLCSEMIAVPSGTYSMGATQEEFKRDLDKYRYMYLNEIPRHKMNVDQFFLAKFAVTRKQFRIFSEETGFRGAGCKILKGNDFVYDASADWKNPGFEQTDDDPVVCVSWFDARKFIDWLNSKSDKKRSLKYRLPTEVEWEYAARAGTTTATYWGDVWGNQCKYENAFDLSARSLNLNAIGRGVNCTDGYVETSPVGKFKSNPWGFSDMLGNVFQWMKDCPIADYNKYPAMPEKSNTSQCRNVAGLRGASWASVPIMVRAAFRAGNIIDSRESTLGFRLAADQVN
jgi:formylglycine-generating enzyme required for sulfatase activity